MGLKININIGDMFGDFFIKEIIKRNSRKYGRYSYKIKCKKCPYEKIVENHSLTKLKPCQFCPIYEQEGKRNGKLVFLEYLGKSLYKAKCDCGNFCKVRKRSSACKKCCLKARPTVYKKSRLFKYGQIKNIDDFIGVKSGYLTVKYIISNPKVILFHCKCKCGKMVILPRKRFGYTKSCGCLQKDSVLRGEKQSFSRYSENDVISMKELFFSGNYTINELSIMFSTSKNSISRILRNKTWKHIILDKKMIENAPKEINKFLTCPKTFTKRNYKDLVGIRFGKRVVIEIIGDIYNSKTKGIVLCDCGKKDKIILYTLLTKKSQMCRECSMEKCKKDYSYLIGQKFGNRTILKITSNLSLRLRGIVKCRCGSEKDLLLHHIISGKAAQNCSECYKKNHAISHNL